MMRRSVAVLLVSLGVASCGDQPGDVVGAAGDGLLTCAGPPFSPSVFEQPADHEQRESPEGDALRRALAEEPFQPDDLHRGWRELGRTDNEIAFGTGDPPVLRGYVVLRRTGDSWDYAQSGDNCIVRPHRPNRTLARWGLDPAGPEVSPATTSLQLIVNDESCASGTGPNERLDDPIVDVTDAEVTITFTSRPPSGSQTCPSHPPARRRVTLPVPLGTRQLRDGAIFPPQPPCRIERDDCANDRELIGND